MNPLSSLSPIFPRPLLYQKQYRKERKKEHYPRVYTMVAPLIAHPSAEAMELAEELTGDISWAAYYDPHFVQKYPRKQQATE